MIVIVIEWFSYYLLLLVHKILAVLFFINTGAIWTVIVMLFMILGDELSQRRIPCGGVCTGSHSKTHELHQRL